MAAEMDTASDATRAVSDSELDEKNHTLPSDYINQHQHNPQQTSAILDLEKAKTQDDANALAEEDQVETTAPPKPAGPPGGMPVFPEGGARAWLVVLGAFIALFCTFGYLNAFGVYEAYYQEFILRDKSASAIAWIGSIQVCFLFGTGLISGSLFDRYGAPPIVIPASIGLILSVFMTSLCKEYYQFILAQGILGGACQGMLFTPCMSSVNHYFFKKRGAAMGLVVAGSSLGGVIFPIMLDRLLSKPHLGFGWSVRIIAFLFLGMLSITCVTMKGRLPRRKGAFFIGAAFKQKSYVLLVLGCFFMIWGLFTPFFYVPSFGITHGMSVNMSIYLVSILNAASFPGRILPGILADKIGRLNMLIFFPMLTSIVVWCWNGVSTNAGLVVWTAVFGFTSGACVSLFPACFASITPNPQNIGTYLGMGSGFIGIAGLTGAPIAGQLIKHGWVAAISWAGANLTLGTIIIAFARLAHDPSPKAKV